jgi:hypothetical protein
MARRYVIVIPPDMPETCAELSAALSGEDVAVVLDRRRGDRRQLTIGRASARAPRIEPLDRRRLERRGLHPPAAIRPPRSPLNLG